MDETVDAGVDEEVLGAEDETGVEEDGLEAPQDEQDDTDWKAIAEKERLEKENYKTALTQKRQLRNVAPAPEEDEDDDTPLTRKDLKNLLRTEVIPLVATSKEDTLLAQKVSDPAKREYVRQLLETRIVRTGTSDSALAEDIDAAIWLADRKKVTKTVSELKRVAANRPLAPSSGSSNEPDTKPKTHKWSATEAQALEKKAKQLGVDPEKFKADAWANVKRTKVL